MAYTIISQNNNTTTLTDGVNTITVPSRVNLTSGNFTIVEVNNNMATLEDGDGNVYRDIPCVATLAGEGGGGGSGLPDQTGHSGEFLTTDGTDASWGDALVNRAAGGGIAIGSNAQSTSGVSIGNYARATSGVLIGSSTEVQSNTNIIIGNVNAVFPKNVVFINTGGTSSVPTGAAQGDFWFRTVAPGAGYATSYLVMDGRGFIPTARLTKVNSTITIAVADWNGGTTVTKTVTGMTTTGVVLVSPDPTDQSAYTSAGIICTAQAADSLTFTCSTTPSADIDVNVVML